jgi:ribosome maturation factor RimP
MAETELDRKILEDCETVVQGMGCRIVEVRSLRGKKGAQVFIVIFRDEGVSLEVCADVLKTLRPRIQMLTNDPGAHIEVSSPGLGRLIKDSREYSIFRGRGLRLLAEDGGEWIAGILTEVSDKTLTLKSGDTSRTFAFSDIRKAKLDHTQEGV